MSSRVSIMDVSLNSAEYSEAKLYLKEDYVTMKLKTYILKRKKLVRALWCYVNAKGLFWSFQKVLIYISFRKLILP